MNKTLRFVYTLMMLCLALYFGYEYFTNNSPDRLHTIFPFLIGLVMLAVFFCVFLVSALFEGEFKLYDFLELVGAFMLLLIVQNATENRLIFISLFSLFGVITIYKLIKTPKSTLEELE